MRTFAMKNARGEVFDMMQRGAFFHSPTGLGLSTEAETSRVGNDFILTKLEETQPAPSGEMVFSGYAQYNEFRDFVRAGGLTLCYKPLDTWYYLEIASISLNRSEIDEDSKLLICGLDMTGRSQWHEELQVYKADTTSSGGKVYPYIYNYIYRDTQTGIIDVQNGLLPSYCRIHIFGPATNPSWNLYQYGDRIATGKVTIELAEGRKLVINTDPASMEIAEYLNDGTYVADRYSSSDFATDRIFQLPAGKCRLSFGQDGTSTVNAWVEVLRRV